MGLRSRPVKEERAAWIPAPETLLDSCDGVDWVGKLEVCDGSCFPT